MMLARSLAMLALMLPPAGPAFAADAEPVILVTAVAYGTHLPGLGEPAAGLAKLLKERSGGALTLDLKQPGDGAKPDEILDKVSSGAIDAGFAPAGLWAAKLPAAPLFSGFPFGPDARLYLDWFEHGDGRKFDQEMYDHAGLKVHVMPCAFGGAESGGWFKKEIATRADLDGLRIRIFGLGARVMSRLGATPVLVPGGDVLAAFAAGKIDAAELYPPAVDERQGLKDKIKLIYMPGWHQPETVLELFINKDRWEALSNHQRGLIQGACLATLQSTLAANAQLEADALAKIANAGVRLAPWPEDVLAALRSAWTEIANEEGDRDYFFRTVFDDIEKFRTKANSSSAPHASAEPEASAEAKAAP
jgi:TRAP-type mannitol/chloroaromatic compound transport system substrate-binding protein